jgi:hypothetical protein
VRRALPAIVLVLVVAAAAGAARVVIDVLERPPDTLDRKLEGADRFLYYVVGENGGPRFELTGSERTVHIVSHALLGGRAPFDPERQTVYGLRFRLLEAGEVQWSRDVWVRSRQSKAGWDGRAWLEESAFSLDPEVQVTDDRAASLRLPDDVPAGAVLDVRLISSTAPPALALVRVYQQIERPRAQAAQTLRSLSPAERAALADRISYVPWDRLSPEEQAARLRYRDQRMSAVGRDGVDYQTQAIWVTKLRLPPPVGPAGADERGAPLVGTGEGVAWNVLGPAELTLWVVRPIGDGGVSGLRIEPLGGLEVTAIGEASGPPTLAIATPHAGDVVERKLVLPEGLHSVQVRNLGAPVRIICVPAGGGQVQFGAEASAVPAGGTAPLRPEVSVLPGYLLDASAKADLLLEGPGDFLTRVLRIDARQIGDFTGQLGTPARLRITALDSEGRTLARDEALLAPVRAPFERLVVRRAPGATPGAASPPVAEPLGFRFLAPVGSARVVVESDRLVFVRPYTLAAASNAGELLAEPYRHVPLEKTTWRYAPFEERAWMPLEAENEAALAAAGREARIEGQVRLEPVPPSDSGAGAVATVDPEGVPPRRLVLESARRGEGRLWSTLVAGRPLSVHLEADAAPRVMIWAPTSQLGQRLAFAVDGKPAGEHVVRSGRGELELPRLAAGPHALAVSGDTRNLRVLVDKVGLDGDVFALRNVYQLGRLRLTLSKGAGPTTLNAIVYASSPGALGGDQLRIVIDGGTPRRLEGVVVERLTIADRRIPLPAADRAPALGFADGGGGGLAARLVAVTLGDDLAPGTHTIELVRAGGEPLWARFFAAGEPRRPGERALQWRLAPSREDSND